MRLRETRRREENKKDGGATDTHSHLPGCCYRQRPIHSQGETCGAQSRVSAWLNTPSRTRPDGKGAGGSDKQVARRMAVSNWLHPYIRVLANNSKQQASSEKLQTPPQAAQGCRVC